MTGMVTASFHRANRCPVGGALVELAAGAPVDGDHRDARTFGPARKIRRVPLVVIPAQPGLQCDRHVNGAHHRLDEVKRVVEVAHQGRAGIAVHHLLGGAAHVDVDDPRTLPLGHSGRLGHPVRFAAGKLHGGVLPPEAKLRPLPRAGTRIHQIVARDHFRHDEAGPEPRDEAAEGQICDSGQWREDHRGRERLACQRNGQVLNPCASFLHLGVFGPDGKSCAAEKPCEPQNAQILGIYAAKLSVIVPGALWPYQTRMSQTTSPSPPQQIAALIVAAGRGARLGGDVPKQYQPLAGEMVLTRTLRAFAGGAAHAPDRGGASPG